MENIVIGGADGPTAIFIAEQGGGMHAELIAALTVLAAAIGITAFHVVHHRLYCRWRRTPGRSHCAVCGHRKACQKYHRKKWER